MSLGDIIILGILFLWLLLSVRYMRKRKKSGKCIGCGGDCTACRAGIRHQTEKGKNQGNV